MNKNRHLPLLLLLSGAPLLPLKGFDIVKDGRAAAVIHVQPGLPRRVSKALECFRADVKAMTGAGLELRNKGENRIEVILQKAGPDTDSTAHVSFPAENTMRITGGVYALARIFPLLTERFGGVVRVYPGKDGTHYPETKDFSIPERPFTFQPVFDLNRALSNQDNNYLDALGAKWSIDCAHNIPRYILPIREYLQTGKWPAPEVFPVIGGKRLDMKREFRKFAPGYQSDFQPCHTSPQSVAEAVGNIDAYLREHPGTVSISLSPNDNRGYCECQQCAALNAGRTDKPVRMFGPAYLYKDHARSYFQWCNRVAEEVLKRHPDVRFGTLAYRETHMAPDFQINPAIVVYLCFDFGCAQYPDVRKRLNAWIGEWAKTGATLGVWEYGFGDSYYTLPRVGFRNQAEIFRLLADNGFRAFFGEGAESLADGPKRYLYMKLMEEPRADIDKLLREWYSACVGEEAAPHLKKYFDFWEAYWPERASLTTFSESRNAVYHTMTPFGPYMYGLRKGDMEYCRKQMENMLAAAERSGTDSQKKRAHRLMETLEYFDSCAKACFAGILPPSGAPENAKQACAVLRALPDAEQAFEKRRKQLDQWAADPALAWWKGIRKMAQKSVTSPTEKALALTAGFAQDPYVREELRAIAGNKKLPLTARHIANTIVKSQKENNLLLDNPDSAPLAKEKHTVAFPLKNGEWQHDIPLSKGKYLVRMKIAVPKECAMEEGAWLNLRLQGRTAFGKPAGAFLDSPKIRPEAGQNYLLYNTLELGERAAKLQITANLFHFKAGSRVVISNIAVIPVGASE